MSHRIYCDRCNRGCFRVDPPGDAFEYYRVDVQPQKGMSCYGNTEYLHLCEPCYLQFKTTFFAVPPQARHL